MRFPPFQKALARVKLNIKLSRTEPHLKFLIVFICMRKGTQFLRKPEEGAGSLELKSQAAVNCWTRVLGI